MNGLSDRERLLVLIRDFEHLKEEVEILQAKIIEVTQYKTETETRIKTLLAIATTLGGILTTLLSKFF